ncbi:PQQ-like beta-propeller repeat protein [Rhodocytophaga rosea]|uniref:PQQ-like beta-propeller repeat protein n=1 Tax=Rhodocytophaga rosea TaxID=2704465 RepID=A0A6C0GM50_9BACT|nr:PQQ-like beta-propeller repeat protein [Rhodocytophaga rosea]QHT68894.1 PQQ-like beta-propeller repeat protein [Rhodocytophaga rosea]
MKVIFCMVCCDTAKLFVKNSLYLICCVLLYACKTDQDARPDQSGLFIKFFGGFDTEEVYAAEQTPDGGFISIGTTTSFGNGSTDMYVFRTDENGNKIWHKTFGDTGKDKGKDLEVLPDGEYVFLGHSTQKDGFSDLNLLKTDKDGNELWSKTFGRSDRNEEAYSLKKTPDGGFLLIGNSIGADESTDMYIVKTTADGTKEWERNYGLTNLKDDVGSVQITNSGNLVWCGSEYRNRTGNTSGSSDMRVTLTKPEGYVLWDRNYGRENTETGIDIQLVSGGFIVVGTTNTVNTANANTDVYVVCLFEDGTEWWSNTYGGEKNEEGRSISPTSDGGFIITGSTESEGAGQKDVYLLKVNRRGEKEWSKTFGGRLDDTGTIVRQTIDGGYLVAGTVTFENNSMMCLIKTDHKGEISGR